jgi:uncharacterized protein YbaR (Trm112 family)
MASVEVLCCPHTPRLRLLWLDDSRGWLVGWLVEVQSFSSTPIRDSLPIGRERVDTP